MNETLPRTEHARAFMASTLIPAVFPTDTWDGATLMDGGAVWNTNLVSAVHRCRETVDEDSEITIDIVVCGYGGLDGSWEFKDSTTNNWLRRKDITDYHTSIGDVAGVMSAFPEVNFRYFLAPT